jgi:uncharacterized membrane protein YsdA (DUF1294 family)
MLGCIQSDLLYEAAGVWILLAGAVGFIAMGVDKGRAVAREWRIPETTLYAVAFAGGAFGTAIGSLAFRHKTSKLSFLAVLYSAVVLWLLLLHQVGFLGCLSTYLPR